MKKCFLITAILALSAIVSVKAQNISHDPVNRNVQVGTDNTATSPVHNKGNLYESGYNAGHNAANATLDPREVRDSVTIGSTMNYFVMPDQYFNPDYFKQNSYGATNLTHSQFNWSMYTGHLTTVTGTPIASPPVAHQNVNANGTSPWVKVTWGAQGTPTNNAPSDIGNYHYTLVMAETPQGVLGACDGEPATIHVVAIPKPTIRFNDSKDYGGDPNEKCDDADLFLTVCTDPEGTPDTTKPESDIGNWNGKDPRTILFPVDVTTQSGNVRVDYNLTFTPLGTSTPITFAKKENQWVSAKTEELPLNIVHADIVAASGGSFTSATPAYGSFNIEIVRITDHVSRKSGVDGDVYTGTDSILGDSDECGSKNVFTYIVLPKPKPGRTFHVPNFFN